MIILWSCSSEWGDYGARGFLPLPTNIDPTKVEVVNSQIFPVEDDMLPCFSTTRVTRFVS